MKEELEQRKAKIRDAFQEDEGTRTLFPGMRLYRFREKRIEMPKAENPYLYLVLGGALRLYTPSGILDYMEGQYSISRIDTPLYGTVLSCAADGAFYALSLEFTVNDVIDTVLQIDNDLTKKITEGTLSEEERDEADRAVPEAICRLAAAMQQPLASDFLKSNLLREIFYYVLCGSMGKAFLQGCTGLQDIDRIYEANTWIKEHYQSPFTVEELAARQNMSLSRFHEKFKSAVGMGPLQCQKRLRLTEAQRLMIDENKNVTEAALDVGYESTSQFTRDYRKMFGASPKEDVMRLKNPQE